MYKKDKTNIINRENVYLLKMIIPERDPKQCGVYMCISYARVVKGCVAGERK